MTKDLKIVELDPATWDRGNAMNAGHMVYLSGPQGMCCMGFAALDFGADILEINERGKWIDSGNGILADRDRIEPDDEEGNSSCRFDSLYEINDQPSLDDEDRVELLNHELEKLDEDFRFKLKEVK